MSFAAIKRRFCENAPLSAQQKNIWINHEIYPENTAYNMVSCLRITGRLNVEALKKSLNEIVRRHEILRTTFSASELEPRQIVHSDMCASVLEVDCSHLTSEERQIKLRQLVDKESQTLFDFQQGPLLRFVFLQMGENESIFLMTVHHIIMDGWSIGLFANEVNVLYESFCNGRPSPLPEISIQYSDYALWQNDEYSKLVQGSDSQYWNETFKDYYFGEFPIDNTRVFGKKGESVAQSTTVSPDLYEKIKSFCKGERATPFIVVLAGLQVLLYKYTHRDNMLLGYLNAGRNVGELSGLLGHFSTLGVIKTTLSDDLNFRDIVKHTRKEFFYSYSQENLIISNLNDNLQKGKFNPRQPFFPLVVNFQNFPGKNWELHDLDIKTEPVVTDTARFDMELIIYFFENEWMVTAQYRKDLYAESTVRQILDNYQNVLLFVIDNPDSPVRGIPVLHFKETNQGAEERSSEEFTPDDYERKDKTTLEHPIEKGSNLGASSTESVLKEIWEDVLEMNGLDVDDNYVDIGGDSLSAVMIVSRIKSRLKSVVAMREFLDNPTIKLLATLIEHRTQNNISEISESADRIPSINRNDDLPLSLFQEGRLGYELSLDVNNVPYLPVSSWFSIKLSGSLDRDVLESAFNYVVNRHEVFRTAFWPVLGSVSPAVNKWHTICQSCRMNPERLLPKVKLKQSTSSSVTMNLNCYDVSEYNDNDKDIEINVIADGIIQRRYDYELPPLTRAALIRTSMSEHVLIVAASHLIADAVAMRVYEKELAHVYSSLVNKRPVNLSNIELQYADYAAWHRCQLETGSLDSVKSYWKQQFEGYTPIDATILPFADIAGSENDADFDLEAKYFYHPISDELSRAVRKYAGSVNMTVFSIAMTGFIMCLRCESNKDDIGVFTFFANRAHPETENIIGMFATGNIVRVKIDKDGSLYQCALNVSESLEGALRNQELMMSPFSSLAGKSPFNFVITRPITCEWIIDDECVPFSGLDVEKAILGRSKSEYALRSFVIDSRERLSLLFQYNLDLFDGADIKRIAARTENIIKEIITNPFAIISSMIL